MELVSVILVHRHGARLPTNPMGNDLLWPQDDSFWKQYKGTISPIGMNQSRNLGEQFRKKYIHLYDGMSPREISDRTKCHSSNINRTIMSAWSFYNGFFPDIPVHLRYLSDRESNDYIETEEQLNKKDMTLGIGIIIEKIKSLDKLFHMGKKDEDLKMWRKENIKKSTFVKEALQNEKDYLNLFDKIFKITQCDKFSPNRSFIDRLSSLKFIYTNIKITECHGFSVIPNTLGLEFTQEEYRMISYATKQICNLQFRPYHNLVAYDRGIKTAGYISNEIVRYFREIINNRNNNIFTSFSGHDTTLLALASSLGIYLNNPPYFTGYFLFELYKNENSDFFVKVYYNHDPTKIGIEELKPRIWKKIKYYKKWDSMEEGVFSFQEFSLLFSQSEFERVNLFLRQFTKGHKVEKSNKIDYITHTSRNRYKMVFRCYDRDDNGFITVDELKEILLKLHEVHITDEDIQKLIEYYDTNKDGRLDSEEFINMVANFIY